MDESKSKVGDAGATRLLCVNQEAVADIARTKEDLARMNDGYRIFLVPTLSLTFVSADVRLSLSGCGELRGQGQHWLRPHMTAAAGAVFFMFIWFQWALGIDS